jgi:hypothetical protein
MLHRNNILDEAGLSAYILHRSIICALQKKHMVPTASEQSRTSQCEPRTGKTP